MTKYKCEVCGYVYDPVKGDAGGGVVAGTSFAGLPETWVCPVCGAPKDRFTPEKADDAKTAAFRRYSNGEIVVIWDSSKCNHNGNCVRSLPSVFDVRKRPWVNIRGAASGEIVEVVDQCPTGALTWERESDGHPSSGVPFTKLEGAGNDYLYINCFSYTAEHDWGELSKRMSDRHFGAGSDGIILVVRSEVADFRMRIFNRDGSEGDMCGNGLRCFAKWVYDLGLTKKTEFEVETRAGIMRPRLNLKDGKVESVTADMGIPLFGRADVPLAEISGPEPVTDLEVQSQGVTYVGTAMFLGNPNYVIFVDDVSTVDLEKVGPGLEYHPAFPKRANVEFVAVRSPEEIDMRVWERGSGITLACGTGACASVVAAILNGKARKGTRVKVNLPGGVVFVEWKENGRVYQTGPARAVYSGLFLLD